jgi:hypothetical protein
MEYVVLAMKIIISMSNVIKCFITFKKDKQNFMFKDCLELWIFRVPTSRKVISMYYPDKWYKAVDYSFDENGLLEHHIEVKNVSGVTFLFLRNLIKIYYICIYFRKK